MACSGGGTHGFAELRAASLAPIYVVAHGTSSQAQRKRMYACVYSRMYIRAYVVRGGTNRNVTQNKPAGIRACAT